MALKGPGLSEEDYEDQTQLNVDVDDPDETKDRPRELAKAQGMLPAEAEGSTLMADPDKMKKLAQEAADQAEADPDDPASIVSFVSNVSVVTQSVEAPSPIGGPMPALPADAEPSTMGSITLEPRSRAPADAEPETIEPRMGVRGMSPGVKRSPIESDSDASPRKPLATEDVTTGSMDHADVLRAVANDPAAAARLAKSIPRPVGKALPKRSKTVIGLAPPQETQVTPDPEAKEAETQADVRIGTLPLGPVTLPLPTSPMRERTNSEEALIAHALAIPPTGSEFQPSKLQEVHDIAPKTLAIPQTPPKGMVAAVPVSPPDPAMPSARTGSSPNVVQPDGPTPAAMAFVPLAGEPPKSSSAGMIVGMVIGGLVLLGAGTVLGWSLRSARLPASAAATVAPAASAPAPVASAEPEKKPDVEAKNDPEPEKKADVEAKNDPPPDKTDKTDKAEKTDTHKKAKTPASKPAKPPPWKPPPKPSAKPAPTPAPPVAGSLDGI